jgi:hypothetical protein
LADHTNCRWWHYLWALHGSWMVNGFDVLIFTVDTWWGKNFQHKIWMWKYWVQAIFHWNTGASKGMDECTLFCNMWKFVFLKSFIRASPPTHCTTHHICLTNLVKWLWLNIFGQYAKVGKSNNSTM